MKNPCKEVLHLTRGQAPKQAWKLFRLKANGRVTPLFANFKSELPINVWMDAELHTTKDLKPRKGWHTVANPSAPHLSEKGRVWLRVEIEDFVKHERNKHQGEAWYVAQRMKILPYSSAIIQLKKANAVTL